MLFNFALRIRSKVDSKDYWFNLGELNTNTLEFNCIYYEIDKLISWYDLNIELFIYDLEYNLGYKDVLKQYKLIKLIKDHNIDVINFSGINHYIKEVESVTSIEAFPTIYSCIKSEKINYDKALFINH